MTKDHQKLPPRVSIPMRVVAGLLAVGITWAAIDGRQAIIKPHAFVESAFQIGACIVCVLLFSYTSIVGTQPRWLDRLSNAADRELTRQSAGRTRFWVSEATVIFVFGAILGLILYFLANDYTFGIKDDQRWFVYCVFLSVWFVVVGLFIWFTKYGLKRLRSRNEGHVSGRDN